MEKATFLQRIPFASSGISMPYRPRGRFYVHEFKEVSLGFSPYFSQSVTNRVKKGVAFRSNVIFSPAVVVMDLYDWYKLCRLLLLLCKSGCGTSTNSEKMRQGPLPCLVPPICPRLCLFLCRHFQFFSEYAELRMSSRKSLNEGVKSIFNPRGE